MLPGQSTTPSSLENERFEASEETLTMTPDQASSSARTKTIHQKLANGLITQAEYNEIIDRTKEFELINSKYQLNLQAESPGTLLAGEVFQRRKRRWLKAFGKTWRVALLDLSRVGSDPRTGLQFTPSWLTHAFWIHRRSTA